MNKKSKNLLQFFVVLLFVGISAWWVTTIRTSADDDFIRYKFGATYGLMALFGAITGFVLSKRWGGLKSSLGKTVVLLAAGLAFAEFGQLVFSYYNIVQKIEIPYPSLADVGFFGNIPLYIVATFYLAKTSGIRLSLKSAGVKLAAFSLPVLSLFLAYTFFLKGYDFTDVSKLQVFLDFGYPLGQALYVSMAVFILFAVTGKLGGLMRSRILLLIAAFIAQYVADFNFLYQTVHETWVNGGYGDYLYFFAYFLMTLSLIRLCAPVNAPPVAEPAKEELVS